ncbi:MAG: IS5 family transposase, partial [Coriobacteriia bacterium]|nr:IS5 family transposase [Coriobacteriia bacterium]
PPAQKNSGSQAIGHSRGGPTTKIHTGVDALGNPCRILLTEGQVHDITQTEALVAGVHNADKGYDSNKVIEVIKSQGCAPVVPARKCCAPREIDWHLYKERALVEGFFQKIKRNRRIAMRFEKLAAHYLAMVCIAAVLVWVA